MRGRAGLASMLVLTGCVLPDYNVGGALSAYLPNNAEIGRTARMDLFATVDVPRFRAEASYERTTYKYCREGASRTYAGDFALDALALSAFYRTRGRNVRYFAGVGAVLTLAIREELSEVTGLERAMNYRLACGVEVGQLQELSAGAQLVYEFGPDDIQADAQPQDFAIDMDGVIVRLTWAYRF